MKHLITTLACLAGMSGTLCAQDFEPGQQAKGLLESRNVTVDHCTGTFHYKVPLHTVKSGKFGLPLSLDYMGSGVKVEDAPGIIGYNWTLNTGGVVTRTVRGGMPDEQGSGFLNTQHRATPLEDDFREVHLRARDGELDLFTAALQARKARALTRRKHARSRHATLELLAL